MSNQSKQLSPLFGVSLTPVAHEAEKVLHLSQVADASGLDLLAIQDHPYKPTFLDTWTLLSLIGGQTRQIRLLAGVSPIALRPPAMLAKAAASLDVLTGGRVEMGVGTGAYWDAIESFGGPRRAPGEAMAALREGIEIMRLLWQGQAGSAVRQRSQLQRALLPPERGTSWTYPAPPHPDLGGCSRPQNATNGWRVGRRLVRPGGGLHFAGASRSEQYAHRHRGPGRWSRSRLGSAHLQSSWHGADPRAGECEEHARHPARSHGRSATTMGGNAPCVLS